MKKWNTVCISMLLINLISLTLSQSLFDNLEQSPAQAISQPQINQGTPEPILQPKMTTTSVNVNEGQEDQNLSNLNSLIEKMKEKVENPALKENLSLESISNFFANILSGNEVMNNLEVKKLGHLNKLEVGEKLKAEGDSEFENISVKDKFVSKVFNITDDKITFNPEAKIKMNNSKLIFRVKDIFEVITFMKYIVKICGSRLERCNFSSLLNDHQQEQIKKIMKLLEEKKDELDKLETNFTAKSNVNEVGKVNQTVKRNKTINLRSPKKPEEKKQVTPTSSTKVNNQANVDANLQTNNQASYMFKEKPNKASELFEHQDEIEKELNLQLKLYKDKQKQELFENSYESFLNQNPGFNEQQTLNDYYYNLDMNFLV